MIPTIEARIKRIREAADMDDALRDKLIDASTKAIEQLRAGDEFIVRAREWSKTSETAPAELEKVKADLAKLAEQPSAGSPQLVGPTAGLAQMQQALARSEAERSHRQQELAAMKEENERRADRRREIAGRDEEIEQELLEVQEALDREPSDEDEAAALATQTLLHARRRALVQEQEMHRQELLAFEITADLVTAQLDLAATRFQAADDQLDALQKAVNEFRRSEASRQFAEARERAAVVHPALRQIAETNVELAAARREIAARIEETVAESEAATARLDELRDKFEKVTERARKIGFTPAIGLLLRKERDAMSLIDDSLRNKRARAASVAQLSVQLTDYEDERAGFADLNSRVRLEMATLQSGMSAAEAATAERDLRELFETRRRSLDSLIRDTTRYIEEMMELETVERQLVTCVRDFGAFSDEHILWIRSAGIPLRADVDRLAAAAGWLVKADHWRIVCGVLADDASSHKGSYAAAAIVLAALAFGRSRLVGRVSLPGAGGASSSSVSRAARREFAAAALAAAWWPSLVAFAGVRLMTVGQTGDFGTILGRSLTRVAIPWFLCGGLCRFVCGREAVHSLFAGDALTLARRAKALRQAMFVAIPLTLIVLMAEAQVSEGPRNTIGRLAFVLVLGVCAATAHRLWCAADGVPERTPIAGTARWSRRGVAALRFTMIAGPLALAVGSIAGYHYTAMQFALRAAETAGFAVCVAMVYAVCSRSVRLANTAEEESAADLDGRPATAAAAGAPTENLTESAEAIESTEAIGRRADTSAQVHRLVRLGTVAVLLGGVLLIWSNVFPALKLLRSVELAPHPFRLIDPATLDEEALLKVVTAAALLAAIGIAVVTLTAARNVRGALELAVFRHVSLDTGARYAVTAICRYVIALGGLFGACSCLGIGWAQLNWLVAAMTVGLGFGLQEIFANFVSGLILLFERPVRIGDIVSVEGVTGTVSRIRIRATTITDGDMRELIVPNKELITGRVINWTLYNTVARMTISIRTAHGVDPDKARNLLLLVAAQHPLVLKRPPPQALFDEFSDKTQNFTLRVFMAHCEAYPQLRHELLTSIQRAFRHAGLALSSSDAAPLPVPVPPPEQRAA